MSQHGAVESDPLVLGTLHHLGEAPPLLAALAGHFLHRVTSTDLPGVAAPALAHALSATLAAGSTRAPGGVAVRFHDGGDGRRQFLSVVTDDMPFLVDSVTLALAQAGLGVDGMLHPQLVVRRAGDGALLDVLAQHVDDPRPDGTLAESWMLVHLAAPLAGEVGAVVAAVQQALVDLRAAHEDAAGMRAHMEQLIAGIEAGAPAAVTSADAEEAAALLTWLLDDHFTILGYREYGIDASGAAQPLTASALGILRTADIDVAAPALGRVESDSGQAHLLIVNKSSTRSTVMRRAYLDHIGIKRFDERGAVVGEHRFLGLFTPEAYLASVSDIPLIRKRVDFVMQALEVVPGSYDARDIVRFLETYPRDELFQTHGAQLLAVVAAADSLRALRQTRLFVRHDDYGRYASCLVYLPRDRYNTAVRERMDAILREAFRGTSSEYSALVTESALARIHYVVQVAADAQVQDVDVRAVEQRIVEATLTWRERFAAGLAERLGEAAASPVVEQFADAFPEAYKEDFSVADAVHDTLELVALPEGALGLHWTVDPELAGHVSFKVNRAGHELPLSKVLPLLQHMGLDVIAERPYNIERTDGSGAWVLDFDVVLPATAVDADGTLGERACGLFQAVWDGACEDDRYNTLVLTAGLDWHEVSVLRAYAHYLKQTGLPFDQAYVQQVLGQHPDIVRQLAALFHARFDPAFAGDRAAAEASLVAGIHSALEAVASLDHDRILRQFLGVMLATLRTNAFLDGSGAVRAIAFKLDGQAVPDLPLPRPRFEIWVCSPRVEGVHLRFGAVARGGLRWSDRREDFRTEVLGLVKAQAVKNAVIVPVGAKGGFVPASLPDPQVDRAAWMAAGQACYREYLRALLDVTDNLVDGAVVPPNCVVRHDGDDPYLVVAADKGTATFSDIANGVAAEYGFWLGDAFASGGSVGYDHKAMGITARGAWEAVKRHFRELGIDTQAQDFTAVGIGDMSGDVFGNGMMLSRHLRLVAAFDHRDIFIDPNPDPSRSLAERQRLFALPRSSWADYDASLLSPGGGVFSRAAKSITLAPEAQAALGVEQSVFTPTELIGAILRAPVDLLWNGGIGTYVKATAQTHAEVGDRANDAIRVNGADLRCRVVGEGGNLGCTQLGRIEAALAGVRINTDAIDNSAGVDTSDHEVNIKILLQPAVQAGQLDAATRVELLASMTDEVARLVLHDNYTQNLMLGVGRASAPALVGVHRRMLADLERRGLLDRALEFLPSDRVLAAREAAGEGLASPELCVLLAYAKMALVHDLGEAGFANDPWCSDLLRRYFPTALVERFGGQLDRHPLRAPIIETMAGNEVLGLGGISFVFRAAEETGASSADVVRAATVVIETFGLQRLWSDICALDNRVPSSTQDRLHLEFRRLLDRATRWVLQSSGASIDVPGLVSRLQPLVREWLPRVPGLLQGDQLAAWTTLRDGYAAEGCPAQLAADVVTLLDAFPLLDLAGIAERTGEAPDTLVPLYYAVSERYRIDSMLTRISSLRRSDRWDTLARLALRSDLYSVAAKLVEGIARATDAGRQQAERIERWEQANAAGLGRARVTLAEIDALEAPSLASMSVLLRVLRTLAAG